MDAVTKIGSGIAILATVVFLLTGLVYTTDDDKEKRKTGIALLSTSFSLLVVGLLVMVFVKMPARYGGGQFFTFVGDFLPLVILMGGIIGLFFLISPTTNITEELQNLQKRTGVIAGVASAILIMTSLLTYSIILKDPNTTYEPYILSMICINLLVSVIALVSTVLGKE